jgi:RNA 2',3'-cyclic 3'-phosphodiesterase
MMPAGTSSAPLRLFVGMRLPADAQTLLAERARRVAAAAAPGLRLVRPANYHVTLAFIGDPSPATPMELTAALEAYLPPVLATALPVDATVDRWGAFPSRRRPRVAWAGIADDGTLGHIAAAVAAALAPMGRAPTTRRFVPHITVGYVRRGALREEPFGTPLPVAFDGVALYNSIPGPDGSTYEEVWKWRVTR